MNQGSTGPEMSPTVLVLTPELHLVGGVSAYFRLLREHLPNFVKYQTIRGRSGSRGLGALLVRLVSDYSRFTCALIKDRCRVVHLNPSLGASALIRDGLCLLIARFLGRRVLVQFHGWNPDFESRLLGWRLQLFRVVYFRASAFVVLADHVATMLQGYGYRGSVYRQTTAVDDSLFGECVSRMIKRERSKAPFRVLFLARVERYKGVYECLQAYQNLSSRIPGIRLTIAGEGEELSEIRDLVSSRQIPDVEIAGYVEGDRKLELFSRAHCYVLPSYAEGMPSTVLEAMAFALPIITCPVGGIRDFFRDGSMGYLVRPTSVNEIVEKVQQLMFDPKKSEEIGEFNRAYASERFSASRVAERLVEIYGKVRL